MTDKKQKKKKAKDPAKVVGKERLEALRDRLTNGSFIPVLQEVNHPWVIIDSPSKVVLVDYKLVKQVQQDKVDVIDNILTVSSEDKQQFLALMKQSGDDYVRFLWDEVVPVLTGLHLGEQEFLEQFDEVLEGEVKINIDLYRSIYQNVAYYKALQFACNRFGLSAEQLDLLFRTRLDEQKIKKANARGYFNQGQTKE